MKGFMFPFISSIILCDEVNQVPLLETLRYLSSVPVKCKHQLICVHYRGSLSDHSPPERAACFPKGSLSLFVMQLSSWITGRLLLTHSMNKRGKCFQSELLKDVRLCLEIPVESLTSWRNP